MWVEMILERFANVVQVYGLGLALMIAVEIVDDVSNIMYWLSVSALVLAVFSHGLNSVLETKPKKGKIVGFIHHRKRFVKIAIVFLDIFAMIVLLSSTSWAILKLGGVLIY
jgi:hypothetical protein